MQTQFTGIKEENAVDILKQSSMRAVQFQRPVSTVCLGTMFIFHYLWVSLETAFNSRCQGNSSVILELYWTLEAEKKRFSFSSESALNEQLVKQPSSQKGKYEFWVKSSQWSHESNFYTLNKIRTSSDRNPTHRFPPSQSLCGKWAPSKCIFPSRTGILSQMIFVEVIKCCRAASGSSWLLWMWWWEGGSLCFHTQVQGNKPKNNQKPARDSSLVL